MIIPFIAADLREVSASSIAYIGDSVYELYARCHVANRSASKSGKMHKMTTNYVCAKSQALAIRALESELTEKEYHFFQKGKNSNPDSMAKNASPIEYKYATGFEALIGYLFLDNQEERLEYIVNRAFEVIDNEGQFS